MVAVIGILVATTGTALGASVAGVGGFTIEADEIRIEGMYIYPGTTDTSGRNGDIPAATVEMQSVEIDGLYLNKTQGLPMGGKMKLTITATDTVTSGQQVLKQSYLETNKTTIHGQVIDEHPQGSGNQPFSIESCGDGFQGETLNITSSCSRGESDTVLEDPYIRAHYLATDRITLVGQKIMISWDKDGDGDYERVFGR